MLATLFAMDPWTILTFVGAASLLYLTPGADMKFTIASGAAGGPLAGLAAERVRKSAGVINKISAVIFGGLAARLAIN